MLGSKIIDEASLYGVSMEIVSVLLSLMDRYVHTYGVPKRERGGTYGSVEKL